MTAGFSGSGAGGPFFSTLLVLNPIGTPPFSVRGLSQVLEPVAASAHFERDVNGTLVDLSPAQFRKVRLQFSCSDGDAPAFDGVWPGTQTVVESASEIAGALAGPGPQWAQVAGTYRTDGSFYFYRPSWTCLVVTWKLKFDEWAADKSWDLTLEEV